MKKKVIIEKERFLPVTSFGKQIDFSPFLVRRVLLYARAVSYSFRSFRSKADNG